MTFLNFWLVLCSVAMISAGQLLFKVAGGRLQAGAAIFEPRVLGIVAGAGTIYAAATILWIFVLRTTPLTKAYPFMALSFVIVPLASVLLLSETVRWPYILGTALIVLGVVVTGLPSSR